MANPFHAAKPLLAIAVALLIHVGASAGEKLHGVEINVQPVPSQDNRSGTPYGTRHGYVEYRVQLKNSASEDRIVYLSYPGQRDAWANSGVVATRTVRVAAGQEALVSLYQPPMHVARKAMEVRVEGEPEERTLPLASLHSWYGYSRADRTAVLLSRNVPQEFREGIRSKTKAKPAAPAPGGPGPMPGRGLPGSGPGTDPFAFLRSELPVSQWSPNWLGYSCYDAIVLSGQEAEEMPPQVQLAVRRFVECGGMLLVHAQKVPAAFSQGGVPDGKGGYWVGLGRAVAGLDGGANDWEATYKKLKDSPPHVYQPTQKPADLFGLLVAEATVPIRGLFVLVLLFGIGIGPANLWLLSRYKRRIWLWWNVPAISLATCLIVFAYSLASEGLTGHGRTASMTLLDERCHRATTIGYVSYYCPLTPSSGPRFGANTDVALLDNETQFRPYGRRGDSGLHMVDWSVDQHLTSGWVNARAPAYFQLRKNEDRRERLSVEKKADGSLKVVNALGADIQRLYLADRSGRVFEGRDITAGAQRTLAAADVTLAPEGGQTLLRNIFTGSEWSSGLHTWMESQTPGATLSPGCYIAFLEKSPFVESPLEGVEAKDSVAIVYGICREETAK